MDSKKNNLNKSNMKIGINGTLWITIFLIVIVILLFLLLIFKKFSITNFYYALTVWSVICTVILNIINSISETKRKKLEKAIEIVNDFDNPDLREARNFTRRFKKEHDENNLQEGKLADFIELRLNNDEMEAFMDKYKFNNKEEIYKLKSSLIYMFNYFQSMYVIIESDMADKNYILRCMKDVYKNLFNRFKVWLAENCETCDKNQFNDLVKLEELANNFKEQK